AAVYSWLPWLVWAAVRLGPLGAALANALLSILAMAATRRGIGPFAEDTGGALVALQVFVMCSAATTLCIAAALRERQRAAQAADDNLRLDALTRLPNRMAFLERVETALRHSAASDSRIGVVLLDLDNFRDLNDRLGHARGDVLLNALAQRPFAASLEDALVARHDRDEFAVLNERHV